MAASVWGIQLIKGRSVAGVTAPPLSCNNSTTPLSYAPKSGITKCRIQSLPESSCFPKTSSKCDLIEEEDDESKGNTKRREALFQIVLAALVSPSIAFAGSAAAASAAADVKEDFSVYSDDENKFKIMIPQDWEVGKGDGNGIRSFTAFYPPNLPAESNVSVLITGLGADFTRLESFGKVDEFAETLVSGLDRSWQRPPGVVAKLINSKASKGFYFIEYTLQNPGESCRHIISSLGIASNGWYTRLYTVTGQFVEEESKKYKSTIEKTVSSFTFT